MRGLPIQYGMIRIASVAGKRRDIRVSGFCKARLLWLFRNYHILDFPVLNPKQQQLIAQMWNSEPGADCKEVVATKNNPAEAVLKAIDPAADDSPGAAADLASLDLIGTVEGYLPQLYAPAQFRVGDPIQSPAVAQPHRLRLNLPESVRIRVLWSAVAAVAVLLLAAVFALGPITSGPMTSGAAAPDAQTLAPMTRVPKAPPLPAVPAAHPSPALVAEGAPYLPHSADAGRPPQPLHPLPEPMTPALPAADPKPVHPVPAVFAHAAAKPSPALVAERAPYLPHSAGVGRPPQPLHPLPEAMALNVSAPDVTPPPARPAVYTKPPAIPSVASRANRFANRSTRQPTNREVMIRVTVDRQGHPHEVQIMRGKSKKTSAALNAARRFAFEPCNRSTDCNHLLKFTDYGDASILQKID